jgi:hypothetical protein
MFRDLCGWVFGLAARPAPEVECARPVPSIGGVDRNDSSRRDPLGRPTRRRTASSRASAPAIAERRSPSVSLPWRTSGSSPVVAG